VSTHSYKLDKYRDAPIQLVQRYNAHLVLSVLPGFDGELNLIR